MTQRIIVKTARTDSVQRRHLTPVRVFDPRTKRFVETGQTSGKVKAGDANDSLKFCPNFAKGRYVTGLEEMVPNPFISLDVMELMGRYSLPEVWRSDKLLPTLVTQESITRQSWYEILDGVEPDYYTSAMPRRALGTNMPMRINFEQPRSFIETFSIILNQGANTFFSDTSRGRFAIQLCMNHPTVAHDRVSLNPVTHDWYIAEIDEEEGERIRIDDLENEAVFALRSTQERYPTFKLYQITVILGLTRGEVSERVIKDQLNRYIKGKGADKEARIKAFLTLMNIFDEQADRFMVMYVVKQARNTGLLYDDAGVVLWKTKVEQPNVYRWKNDNTLIEFLKEEYSKLDPKSESQINYFGEMVSELRARGIEVK